MVKGNVVASAASGKSGGLLDQDRCENFARRWSVSFNMVTYPRRSTRIAAVQNSRLRNSNLFAFVNER